jgi:3'(2'), 5'-bisphosphate nucleotidase
VCWAAHGQQAADLQVLEAIEEIAREAGALILQVYGSAFDVAHKADASPVTQADEWAEAHIVAALQKLDSSIPIVAEEATSRSEARGEAHGATPALASRFWLVDPLDGTREFVSRNGEFTVNIALIENGLPVLGVVYVPVQNRMYAGDVRRGAWLAEANGRRAIRCRAMPDDGAVLACSRSHGDEAAMATWLAQTRQTRPGLRIASRIAVGSSLKFGLIAAGQADIYPRLGRTMEWDTAAGHAVARAAGGEVFTLAGEPLRYGKPKFENPHFVAQGLTPGGT